MLHKVCLRTGRQRHSSRARPSPHANASLRAVLLRKVSKDVELQEDRNVFAQLMMVSKSLPEIDIREAIGQHEFLVIPRSLFANDGTMFHCSMKSALMSILEKTGESLDISRADDSVASSAPSTVTVAIID